MSPHLSIRRPNKPDQGDGHGSEDEQPWKVQLEDPGPEQPVEQSPAPAGEPSLERPVEKAIEPVVQPAEPVVQTAEPVAGAVEPAAEAVAKAVEPVARPVARVVEPVAPPVVKAVANVVEKAAEPVVQPVDKAAAKAVEPLAPAVEPLAPAVDLPAAPEPATHEPRASAEPPTPKPETEQAPALSPTARSALEELAALASAPPEPTATVETAAVPPSALPLDRMLVDGLLAGVSPQRLATDFGTPLFVYDLDLAARRIDALGSVLPFGFRLAFAVKANPALGVLAHIAGTGIGADIASVGELEAALRAGFAPVSIAMTGPGKRDEELAAAVNAGIGAITVESPGELRRLDDIAARLRRRQPVLLRLSIGSGGKKAERIRLISGAEGKFGMPLADLKAAAVAAAASPNLELLGVHAFGASNVTEAKRIADHLSELVEVGKEVAAAAGVHLRLVDAGGGLGIPYSDGDPVLNLGQLGSRLEELRRRWDADTALREMEVLLEPGRFFMGPAGAYVTRIVDVKGTPDNAVAIVDGGINHLVRPALVRQEQRVVILAPDAAERPLVPTLVAGPLCTGLDVLTLKTSLPAPRVGDLVAVLDTGAYGFTESMPFFLSHPTAAEAAVRGGEARLIRPRIAPREMLDRQIAPRW